MNNFLDDAASLSTLSPDLYTQADNNFTNTYLAVLLASCLAADLPNIISANPIITERADDSHTTVFHVGGIKLILTAASKIGVVVSTHDERAEGRFSSALMVTICHEPGLHFLTAEFAMVVPPGRTHEFVVRLPNTSRHPLTSMLMSLKLALCRRPEVASVDLKMWAAHQKK